MFRVALALLALFSFIPAAAQIVVSQAGEEPKRPMTVESVVCQIVLDDNRIGYSAMIWVPNDLPTQQRIAREFEAYVDANVINGRFAECIETPSYNGSPKTEGRILGTNWDGGYPTSPPGKDQQDAATASAGGKAWFCSSEQYGDNQHFVAVVESEASESEINSQWDDALRKVTQASLSFESCNEHKDIQSAREQLKGYTDTYSKRGYPIVPVPFTPAGPASSKLKRKTVAFEDAHLAGYQ